MVGCRSIQVLSDELNNWTELLILDEVYGRNTPYECSTLPFVLETRKKHPHIAIIILTDDKAALGQRLEEISSKDRYQGLARVGGLDKNGLIREPATPNECKTVINSERLAAFIKDEARDQHEIYRMGVLQKLIREGEPEIIELGKKITQYHFELATLKEGRNSREIKARKSGTQP